MLNLSTDRARSMSDRKAELERKKAKLQALREEKIRRQKEKEKKDAEEFAIRATTSEKDQQKELDQMLSLVGVAPVSDVLSNLSSLSLTPEHSNNATPEPSLQSHSTPPSSGRRRGTQLSVVSVQSTNIPPREMVTYTKQTQTLSSGHERDDSICLGIMSGILQQYNC
ncbi:hypothetical protein L9F63_022919, partial [Diploptera punctata]